MKEFVRFAKLSSIPDGAGRLKLIEGIPVFVGRMKDRLYGFVAVCPHKFYVLCERKIVDGKLICPGHGEVFDIESGTPSKGFSKEPLKKLSLKIEDGIVYVEKPEKQVLEWIISNTSE